MTPLILILIQCLVAVNGATYPAPTPAARLDERQGLGVTTVWSPTIVGTTVLYEPFRITSGTYTVTTSGYYWGFCSVGFPDCIPATACQLGTLLYPLSIYACPSGGICGTETLYSTTGAALGLTRFACYGITGGNTKTFFIVSPTAGPSSTTTSLTTSTTSLTSSSPGPTTTTTTSSYSLSTTPPPTPSKPPVGAIVGGVVGGLAVLTLGVVAVLLFLRRRNQPAPMNISAPEVVQEQHSQQQQPSPVASYNPKYTSYSSISPTASNFPLPMYQSTAGQNEASYTSPSASPTFSNPIELSAYTAAMHGVGEGNAHQVRR